MPRKTNGRFWHWNVHTDASMRPRPDAAENSVGRRGKPCGECRFNEAAARCRGKQQWRAKKQRARARLQ